MAGLRGAVKVELEHRLTASVMEYKMLSNRECMAPILRVMGIPRSLETDFGVLLSFADDAMDVAEDIEEGQPVYMDTREGIELAHARAVASMLRIASHAKETRGEDWGGAGVKALAAAKWIAELQVAAPAAYRCAESLFPLAIAKLCCALVVAARRGACCGCGG